MGRITDQELREAVVNSRYLAEMARNIGRSPKGGSYTNLRRRIKALDIDTSHWLTPSEISRLLAQEGACCVRTLTPEEVLGDFGRKEPAVRLRRLLLEIGRPWKCAECGITEWLGEKVDLEIDHINRCNTDNRSENLQFLCSNCHTFKTLREQRVPEEERLKRNREKGERRRRAKGVKPRGKPLAATCRTCNGPVSRGNQRCQACFSASQTVISWPATSTLVEMVKSSSYVAVGKELGVSDNAVRKRVRNHPESMGA